MSLPLTYLAVVLIWAVTPLAIQWSTIALAPLASVALLLGIVGLGVICIDRQALGDRAILGILLLLDSSFLFALSSLLVKRWGAAAAPMEQLLGSLLVATPGLVVVALLVPGPPYYQWSPMSLGALLFLSLVGSFAGYLAYYHLVRSLDVMLVALIPLITPMLAMWLGHSLNAEVITSRLLVGSGLILTGLALFNHKVFYPARLISRLRAR